MTDLYEAFRKAPLVKRKCVTPEQWWGWTKYHNLLMEEVERQSAKPSINPVLLRLVLFIASVMFLISSLTIFF
jgi:hypothetical protein